MNISTVSNQRIQFTRFILIIIVAIFSLWLEPISPSKAATAYIDPSLTAMSVDEMSVIVTGVDVETAVSAINTVGGNITSELWLIDAAGATITADQLDNLATQPGIISIVNNQSVSVAGGPDCSDGPTEHGPCSSRPGWVTDRREKKETTVLPASPNLASAIVQLPDGRFVAIAEKQYVVFWDAEGNIQTFISDLDFDKMNNDPVVGQDGTVYFIGELAGSDDKMIIYAIDPTGEVLWSYKQSNLIPGLALSPDSQYLYVLEAGTKAKLYILDAQEGDLLEKAEPGTKNPGIFAAPPVVAPDGTVYLQSTGKEPDKYDRKGNVIALDPALSLNDDKAYMWRFEAQLGENYLELDFLPVISDNFIYVFNDKDKMVLALDPITGDLLHTYSYPTKLNEQPTIGQDQTLYLPLDGEWHALNADLSVRFVKTVDDGKLSTPIFAHDGTAVYLRAKKTIYAYDTASGALLWQVSLKGDIKAALELDEEGNIIAGSDGKDLAIITPNGRVTTRLRLDNRFNQVMSTSLPDDQMLILMGDKELVTIGFLPNQWDPNMVDVQEADYHEWEIVNMVSIDVGADILHDTELMLPDQDGNPVSTPLSGAGVTIAVLDSGIYVDGNVKNLLNSDAYATDLKKQYVGQYDFVGDGNGPDCDTGKDYNSEEGFCFFEWDKSHDRYGHGSHVAGIIWSQITDASTSVSMGIAPGANVVSVRVLGDDGTGTYEDVVQGIQWAVENQNNPEFDFPIRVLNLSLSAEPNLPYFMDPINRAVENAWAAGIVVLAAAGNEGPGAQNISVPGNDPYVITVGAINSKRTPGYWADDVLPEWSSNGPTLDGFVKPDVLAPGSQIVSFINNDGDEIAQLLQDHPDYSETMSLFRMNGTSMATAVTSGVVALMLEANPDLTPDQVKFRLMYSAKPALTADGEMQYSPLQQGAGRIWAPDAVLGTEFPEDGVANAGRDLESDLAHGWALLDENGDLQFDDAGYPILDESEYSYHYQGPVRGVVSDDDQVVIYYIKNPLDGSIVVFGAAQTSDLTWFDYETLTNLELSFDYAGTDGAPWQHANAWSSGAYAWSGGAYAWSGGAYAWSGGAYAWSGGAYAWSGGAYAWSGGAYAWSGGAYAWSGGAYAWSGGAYAWSGSDDLTALTIGANKWIEDDRPDGFTVHVADLDSTGAWISNSSWEQIVTITIRDEYQSRIENATIIGTWNQGTGEDVLCTTGVNGECGVSSGPLAENISSVTFTISDILHDSLGYVPAENMDLEGDSNGHSITGQRPTYRPSIHIADLDGSSAWISSSAWSADIAILALDDQGNPVGDATILAHWKTGLTGNISCVTDATGLCVINAPSINDNTAKVELQIDFIDHAMLYYNDDHNTDPDGDSNGTVIPVLSPANRPSVHITDLDGSSAWISSSAWSADITLLALDNQGNPAVDAAIVAHWKSGLTGSISCVTDVTGLCVINAPSISDNTTKIEFEIDFIDHAMLYYAESYNSDPDGDSNGTMIPVLPPANRPSVHIADLDGSSTWISSSAWSADITLLALDDQGNPVGDATILAHWINGLTGNISCVTDVTGQCFVHVPSISDNADKIELEIDFIDHTMLHYNDDDNTDPDGDTNGEKIVVKPPVYRPGMQMSNISGTAVFLTNTEWQASITITVIDDNGLPVSDVLVAGVWKNGLSGTDSCITTTNGQCSITGILFTSQDEAKFEVQSLTHAMLINNSGTATMTIDQPE